MARSLDADRAKLCVLSLEAGSVVMKLQLQQVGTLQISGYVQLAVLVLEYLTLGTRISNLRRALARGGLGGDEAAAAAGRQGYTHSLQYSY